MYIMYTIQGCYTTREFITTDLYGNHLMYLPGPAVCQAVIIIHWLYFYFLANMASVRSNTLTDFTLFS